MVVLAKGLDKTRKKDSYPDQSLPVSCSNEQPYDTHFWTEFQVPKPRKL